MNLLGVFLTLLPLKTPDTILQFKCIIQDISLCLTYTEDLNKSMIEFRKPYQTGDLNETIIELKKSYLTMFISMLFNDKLCHGQKN